MSFKNILYCCLFSVLSVSAKSQTNNHNMPVLNHIAVYVKDLQKSAVFYTHIIGLDTIPEPFHDGRHVWLSTGAQSHLHLIQGADEISYHNKNNHTCFSVNDINHFIKTLNENNIGYENWAGDKQQVTIRVDGVHQIYFTDPDGYWVEINDAKE